jgi:hypothetical protein
MRICEHLRTSSAQPAARGGKKNCGEGARANTRLVKVQVVSTRLPRLRIAERHERLVNLTTSGHLNLRVKPI